MIAALERALARPGHTRGLVRIVTPVAARSLEALFDALPAEEAVYWASGGEVCLAIGGARRYTASGAARFASMRDQTAGLPAWARLFGGFAFAPDRAGALPDAWAILPRFLFRKRGRTATLAMVIDRATPDADRAALRALSIAMSAAPVPRARAGSLAPLDELDFLARVGRACNEIAAGKLDKVVLHQQRHLALRGAPKAAAALAQLAVAQPSTTRYAFRIHGAVFLGATPERLVLRRGRQVRADVLAGSLPRDGVARARALLLSAKDRAEHELTRRAIVDVLGPRCRRLTETGPRVRALPHLYHLHTAVRGELASDRHVLELVAALHPTPAVGGAPRSAALAFLAAEEPASRAWYAAPIGWFRPNGDGDFRVALRCALLERDHATLYAGAGVVAGSDPARELVEVAWKQRAMQSALGVRALERT